MRCCMLHVTYCLLYATSCMLYVTSCKIRTVCCKLCITSYIWLVVSYMLLFQIPLSHWFHLLSYFIFSFFILFNAHTCLCKNIKCKTYIKPVDSVRITISLLPICISQTTIQMGVVRSIISFWNVVNSFTMCF